MQLNKITFAGYLGKDPETFSTQAGKLIVTLNIAFSYKKPGSEEKQTTWADAKVFGTWAQTAKNYKKGDNVVVEGQLSENKWKDKETGKDRTKLEIIAYSIGKFEKGGKYEQPTNHLDEPKAPPLDITDEGIPF